MVCVPIAYYFNKPDDKKKLAIISPIDLDTDVVDPELRNKGRAHFISDFELTDQYNEKFSSKAIKGKIWIVEYFFSTCCLLYTSPSPRDAHESRMPSSA